MGVYITFKDGSDSANLSTRKSIHLSDLDYEADIQGAKIEDALVDSKKVYGPFIENTPIKKKAPKN